MWRRCFKEYGLHTDDSGKLRRDVQTISLDRPGLGISVASAVLRREATGAATGLSRVT